FCATLRDEKWLSKIFFTAKKNFSFPLCSFVLCGSNSNLATYINPRVYGAFKLKSVPLLARSHIQKVELE
ncbi:hypothetical protein, partial [Endozoicomonas sp. ONNA2]|uniref:hypothetical protein n=1 Tax=Endozoicomonas sp. ONNA2 TaxID=2828741 RepID=UPI002148EB1B